MNHTNGPMSTVINTSNKTIKHKLHYQNTDNPNTTWMCKETKNTIRQIHEKHKLMNKMIITWIHQIKMKIYKDIIK